MQDVEKEFRRASQDGGVLACFPSPSALVVYLTSPGGDLDRKDEIYRELVRIVQKNDGRFELASSVLWLGLWPALDRIYRRRLKLFRGGEDDPVSAIGLSFTAAVQRADLSRITRLAATLTMNAERNLVDELRRGWRQTVNEEGRDADGLEEAANGAQLRSGAPAEAVTEGLALADARARLIAAVGEDADLLLAVLVQGENQREAADRLGIGRAKASKRYQRALTRIREHFPDLLSHSTPKDRVSLGKRTKDSKRGPVK